MPDRGPPSAEGDERKANGDDRGADGGEDAEAHPSDLDHLLVVVRGADRRRAVMQPDDGDQSTEQCRQRRVVAPASQPGS